TDAEVADALTIDGGTIDNTPIGGSTPSTGVFTNTTSTNLAVSGQASTTYLTVSQNLDVDGTVDLNGGTIDNTVIGGSTPAAGTFTNLSATDATSTSLAVTGQASTTQLTVSQNATIGGNLTVNGLINPGFTQGSVVFQGATGLTQDNTNFFWDDTNDKLGIGSSTPFATLSVQSAAATTKTLLLQGATSQTADILTLQNAGGDDLLTVDNDGRTVWSVATTTSAIVINQNGSGNIAEFQYQTSTVFAIGPNQVTSYVPFSVESTGDTGIAGTLQFTNPTASYIKSDSPLYITAGDLASNEDLILSANNLGDVIVDDTLIVQASSTTAVARFNTTGDGNSSNIIEIEDDGTDVAVFDSLGYFGLGTSSPTALLSVGSSTPGSIDVGNYYNSLFVSGDVELDGTLYGANTTLTNATATTLAITGQASTTNLTISNKLVVGNYTLPNADGAANYVLKTDGSGNVTWQADATGGGGGGSVAQLGQIGDVTTSTLAYGHVLTWNGSGWVDSATSSLGLAATLDDAYNNDGGERTVTVDDGDVSWDLSGGNNFVIDIQGTSDKFQVQDAGTVRFQIADTGVAELTAASSTAAALTIDQTSTGDILVLQNGGTNALVFDDSNYLSVYDSDASDYIRIYHDGTNGRIDVSSGDLEIGSGGGDLRVYDSAGTNYLQLTHDGSDAQISSSAGDVEIGVAGNDVLVGDVGSASNLVFEESSTISGQGSNTITIGVNGDTIDLGVSGVEYRVRDLVATSTSLTIDVNNTATTTVVFENTTDTSGYDELVHLAVEGTANFGATTSTEYNRFGLGTPGQAAITGTDDVFITGDIEVDGTAYLSGGTAWTQGDFAEEMSVYESFAQPGDVIVINREYAYASSSDLYMGRMSHEGNSNEILGVITTDPAGVLKFGVYGDNGQPIVLTGTSPVRVTDENGQVRRGDLLTTSDTVLGAAMRATTAEAGTIGIALEDDNGNGLVSTLINVKNNAGFSAYEEVTLPDATSTSTATSTDTNTSKPTTNPDIVVIDDGDGDQDVVVIEYEELANIRVEGLAEFTGSISVVDAEFTGRLLVLGEIIIAGDLDISGAITTWFWDDAVYGSSTDPIELGDAVAVVGDNSVATMWANSKGFRPATGIAVAFKPFESLTEDDINNMPEHLRSKYDELTSVESVVDVATSTATSTEITASSTIVIDITDEDLSQFRMVKVAIGGVVKGYTDLIAGNRYFLSVNDTIVRDDIIADSDEDFQDVVNTIDDLLEQADNLSSTSTEEQIAGEEEVLVDEASKLSRTLSFEQPVVNGAIVQVVGIAKSATEFLIQPSLNYSRYQDGYLTWDFEGAYVTSTVSTSTEVANEEPAVEVFQSNDTTIIVNNTGEEIDVNDYLPQNNVETENNEDVVDEATAEETTEETSEETTEGEVEGTEAQTDTTESSTEETTEETSEEISEEVVEPEAETVEEEQTEVVEEQVEESPVAAEEPTNTEG
ncbi:MAG: beta strand repeat-containing protein, partial [Patescibacteria group bacterium]